MEFKDVIQNRYSCKDFSTQQIEKRKINGNIGSRKSCSNGLKTCKNKKSMLFNQKNI